MSEATDKITGETTAQVTPEVADEFLTRYERFLNREPLNEELAAVQRGEARFVNEAVAGERKEPAAEAVGEVRRGITRADRVELRELKQSDGWPVLMWLWKKRLEVLKERAISISQDDPLANGQVISKEWAYYLAYKRALEEMEVLLDAELKTLFDEER